ncbi:MAG: hypothetical protein ACYDEJ_12680 [Desulfitobacteriaceae bacterium]
MLITTLKFIASIINYMHDRLLFFSNSMHLNFNDKQLHFIVIGFVGLLLFLIVNRLFKFLAHYSIEAISFVYTFTVLVVVVFAIEIEQKVTGHGKMELLDIADGLRGFIVAFFIYLLLRTAIWGIRKVYLRLSR